MFELHLNKSKQTYQQHLIWAVKAGVRMILAGLASVIHGFIPRLFDDHAPRTIIDIYHKHLTNHPNTDYQDLITRAKNNNN